MRRRYLVILGVLTAALGSLALATILGRGQIYQALVPFYETTDYVNRDDGTMYRLELASSALYDITPWAVFAALIPLIAALALLRLQPPASVTGVAAAPRSPEREP